MINPDPTSQTQTPTDHNNGQVDDMNIDSLTQLKPQEIPVETDNQMPENKPIATGEIHVPTMPAVEDPRITDKDRSFKQIFGSNNGDDDIFPKTVKRVANNTPNTNNGQIEIQQYDIPLSKENHTEDHGEPEVNQRPVVDHYQFNNNRSVAVTTVISMIVLVLGLGSGFFGYKYYPDLLKNNAISADTISQDNPAQIAPLIEISPSISPSVSASPSASGDLTSNWTNYNNDKYKYIIKFPDTWFGQNTDNTQADTATFTSIKPSTTTTADGYKVEISFQNTNSKLLKDWIADDNTIGGYGTPNLTLLKIDGKDAYQQTITASTKQINTYVFQANKVMIISYYAPTKTFDTGKVIYQNMINSIKLL